MNNIDLFKIFLDNNYNLQIFLNKWIWIFTLILALIIAIKNQKYLRSLLRTKIDVDQAHIGIGQHKIVIKPNYQVEQIAYKLLVDLQTRKMAIEIDFEKDIIIELYNSWYQFLKDTRSSIKEIPIHRVLSDKNTKKVTDIAMNILNRILRPHLTTWQGKFTMWYQNEILKEENKKLSPQELQKKYPLYDQLKDDLKKCNKNLIEYKNLLEKIVGI